MTEKIPLFPLNAVLFPGAFLPLRVFEPRYTDLVSECLHASTGFGISLIREGREVGEAAKCFDIGTYAEIVDWHREEDGLLGIVVKGERRFRVESYSVRSNNLLEGEVVWLGGEAEMPCPVQYQCLRALLEKIVKRYELPYQEQMEKSRDASWLGNRLAEVIPVETVIKQQLLEIDDPVQRLAQLSNIINQSHSL